MSSTYRMKLFLDESGEFSCSAASAFQHFCVTVLSIPSSRTNVIKHRFKRQVRKLIHQGWSKNREVRATDLHGDGRFGPAAVERFITYLAGIDDLQVSYIVVNKNAITLPSFREASYGIRYNYFCGRLLSDLIFLDGINSAHLTYDLRNKETHSKKHFREYIYTKIQGEAFENGEDVNFALDGMESDACYGLMAVDFFCWAVFRKFEHGDARYFDLFANKLLRGREWYVEK